MATSNEPVDATSPLTDHQRLHAKKPIFVLAAVLVVLAVFAFGMLAGHASSRFQTMRFGGDDLSSRGAGMMGERFGGSRSGQGGQPASQTRIEGVVTAVNGNTVTIAGGGATNSVTTNSSTGYTGGNQPVVNDTVIVFGSTSNNVFTATHITINP